MVFILLLSITIRMLILDLWTLTLFHSIQNQISNVMITAPKKTMLINSFTKQAITKPRDLYAKYGKRASTSAIHSASKDTSGSVMPSGSAVIQSMISAQEILKTASSEDLPE